MEKMPYLAMLKKKLSYHKESVLSHDRAVSFRVMVRIGLGLAL